MVGLQLSGKQHEENVVGGVARGGQHAASVACLVQRAVVEHTRRDVLTLDRDQPHLRGTRPFYSRSIT